MVALTAKRDTLTVRVCPIRCARSIAWSSVVGFHHTSSSRTCEAATRLRPKLAALSDMIMTVTCSVNKVKLSSGLKDPRTCFSLVQRLLSMKTCKATSRSTPRLADCDHGRDQVQTFCSELQILAGTAVVRKLTLLTEILKNVTPLRGENQAKLIPHRARTTTSQSGALD